MAVVGVVKAIITADTTQLKKGMTDAQRSMDRMGKQMSKVGKSMTMKVTMPLVGVGLAAAKMASDFEFSMTQIETLVGRSTKEVDTLKSAVLGLSGETGRAPKELADAMFFITSAGLDAASATAALEMSAKAAAVGLGDTSVVADAVTNAMNGYGMAADGAAFATDVLAKTVEQGKASAADLAPQFGRLIPMAAELGISFDQIGGGLAFLTRSSGDASLSATQLGGVMKSILKPSQQALKTFGEIGVDLKGLRAAASEDLLGALQSLRDKLEANGLEMSNVFEDIRGLNGALMLTGKATGQAREVFDELADSTGKLDEAFRGVQKTAQFKVSVAMSSMKASMITLGEQILPVIVPMIAALAGWIGSLATAFGNLSGPVQKTVVILGVILAATGPLLMMLGSITSALVTLGVVSAGATVSLSALLGPIALIVAAGAGLFLLFSKMGDESKKAEERQEELAAAFVLSGDKSSLLSDKLDSLIERHNALADATKEAAEETEVFAGQSVLMGQAMKNKVGKQIENLSATVENLGPILATGTDEFQRLEGQVSMLGTVTDESLIKALRNADPAVRDVTDALAKQFEQGDLNRSQLRRMLDALDETADAYDDYNEKLEENAKKILTDSDKTAEMAQILGADMVESLIAVADKGDRWDEILGVLTTKMEHVITAEEEAARAALELAAAQAATAQQFADSSAAMSGYADAVKQADRETSGFAETAWAGKRVADQFAESSKDVAEAMNVEAAAARSVAQAISDASDAKLHSMGGDFTGGRELSREVAYRKKITDAEKAITEAQTKQVELRQQALGLANSLRAAERDVQAALDAQESANRDILRAKADQLEIAEKITRLEEEQISLGFDKDRIDTRALAIAQEIAELQATRLDAMFDEVEFARAFEHAMDKAKLTVIDLQKKVDDLKATQEATVDTTTAKGTVAALEAQRAATNEVEQALIDMGVIAAEDSGLTDLTVKEARALQRLERQLREVEQGYEDGEADVLQLMAATQDYDRAMADARLGSEDLRVAQEALSKANAAAIELKQEQENIDLKLKVAEEDLRLAHVAANEETQRGIIVDQHRLDIGEQIAKLTEKASAGAEKKAGIDARLTEITKQLAAADQDKAAAVEAQAKAESRLAAAVTEHSFAQVRLSRVQEEINTVQSTQNDLWRELVDLINDAGGAFRDLKKDMEKVTEAGRASASAAATAAAVTAGNAVPKGTTGSALDRFPSVGIDPVAIAQVTGMGGAGLWEGILGNESTTEGNVSGRFGALRESLLGGQSPESISDFLATLAPSAATGGFVKSAGLVNVHAGETITPGGGGATYITVNVEGSVSSERDLVESIRRGLLRSQQSGRAVVLN